MESCLIKYLRYYVPKWKNKDKDKEFYKLFNDKDIIKNKSQLCE
jgi:hypothetical protein